jgi:prepilin-type N-terminal cleavage/methylation domain-containing protein
MRFHLFHKKQSGFTLVEMTVAMAITGVLGVAIFTGLLQIRNVNDADNARMSAVKQVENALFYLNRDTQSAQTITPDGSTGFPLTLSWKEWEPPTQIEIVYTLKKRTGTNYYDLYRDDQVVAQYISNGSGDTNCSFSLNDHKFTITITSAFPIGSRVDRETRRLEIIPRPGS